MNSQKKKKLWFVLTLLSPSISDLKGCFNSANSLINVGFFSRTAGGMIYIEQKKGQIG